MDPKIGVRWSVFRKNSNGDLEKMQEIVIDSNDFGEKTYNPTDSVAVSYVFQLRNDQKLAKSLATASVTMPWLRIEPEGREIQLSRQLVDLGDAYFCKVEPIFYDYNVHKNPDVTCGKCKLFSRDKGREILNHESHTFAGGDKGKMNIAIVDAISDTHQRPNLTDSNVGYCPKLKMLCADVSPGCNEPDPV